MSHNRILSAPTRQHDEKNTNFHLQVSEFLSFSKEKQKNFVDQICGMIPTYLLALMYRPDR